MHVVNMQFTSLSMQISHSVRFDGKNFLIEGFNFWQIGQIKFPVPNTKSDVDPDAPAAPPPPPPPLPLPSSSSSEKPVLAPPPADAFPFPFPLNAASPAAINSESLILPSPSRSNICSKLSCSEPGRRRSATLALAIGTSPPFSSVYSRLNVWNKEGSVPYVAS